MRRNDLPPPADRQSQRAFSKSRLVPSYRIARCRPLGGRRRFTETTKIPKLPAFRTHFLPSGGRYLVLSDGYTSVVPGILLHGNGLSEVLLRTVFHVPSVTAKKLVKVGRKPRSAALLSPPKFVLLRRLEVATPQGGATPVIGRSCFTPISVQRTLFRRDT